MSIQDSVSLGGTITKFQTVNFSTAKQTFSFGGASRFPSVQKPNHNLISYDPGSTLKKRTCGFGYGERFKTPEVLRDRRASPPSTKYNLKSEFDIGNPKQPSSKTKGGIYGFGLGREHFTKVYMPNAHYQTKSTLGIPGPGSYDDKLKTITANDNRKVAMKGRIVDVNEPLMANIKKNIPGPGTYGMGIEINKYGVYTLSTIQNSRAANWSPSKERFNRNELKERIKVPGPGSYNPSDYDGVQYLLSNFKTYGTRKYMKDSYSGSKRLSLVNTKADTPGPGTYMPPSEFGHLDFQGRGSPTSRSPTSQRAKIRTANSFMNGHMGQGLDTAMGTQNTVQTTTAVSTSKGQPRTRNHQFANTFNDGFHRKKSQQTKRKNNLSDLTGGNQKQNQIHQKGVY